MYEDSRLRNSFSRPTSDNPMGDGEWMRRRDQALEWTPMSKNERKTENLVRDALRKLGYYRANSGIIVEEQKSEMPRIQKLLENASKKGGGVGKPEFIIRSTHRSEFLIVIECKASPLDHVSPTLDKYSQFAVDGALLYASYLSRGYDVIAIGVSGEEQSSLRISHYLHLRGEASAGEFPQPQAFASFEDYFKAFISSDAKFRQDYRALLDYSRDLNHTLHTRKVTEAERAFLISGILISLQNEAFVKGYGAHRTGKQLAVHLLDTIEGEFETAKLPVARREQLNQAFSFIPHSPALHDTDFAVELIDGINDNINSFIQTHQYYDTIGQFYVEFLRYANNDKGLGIVLTPPHIAELFADLAEVNQDSVVFDNCCGTAGLLIAAMKVMVRGAGADQSRIKQVKSRQLFGIEYQQKMYALAVSNMILHGDGKTNILRGDCFQDQGKLFKNVKPTIGILNPPYKNKNAKNDKEELEYVFNNLSALATGGKCVAIVPITCATASGGMTGEWKAKIMERHTLEAVMSMPFELFHNSKTNVVTCIMVFTAHRPHPSGKKTWFGYWRDDGFIKTKHRGRIDAHNRWPKIREAWVSAYRSREVVDGLSVIREVGPHDEWCAEAYMETDYSTITQADFERELKRYAAFKLLHEQLADGEAYEDAD